MSHASKKYQRNCTKRPQSPVTVAEGVGILKKLEGAKFDETVELAVKLGIDPKNTSHAVRGSYSLPHGIGKEMRVIVFADGDAAKAAKAAGALEVGAEDLAKKILDGWMEFDVAIAHPAMMRHVGKLGRVLGPQGKMPSPKSGTVTDNIGPAVREFKAGKVEFRSDDGGNVHCVVGKKSFPPEHLVANVDAFLDHLRTLRHASVKGNFISKVTLSATMSPGVPIAVASSAS
ncbi:MAG: 50S ribosomal protein L1 [Planctomycetes bacterium]|nr:50S ribosomal protein L1 [Planctomycetota bacterium]